MKIGDIILGVLNMIGIIKSFDQNNFSGVITCSSTGEDVSFSLPSIASAHYKQLYEGQRVQFYIEQGSQNESHHIATKVTAVD